MKFIPESVLKFTQGSLCNTSFKNFMVTGFRPYIHVHVHNHRVRKWNRHVQMLSLCIFLVLCALLVIVVWFQNRIESIENLDCLKNLTFIHLANNRIQKIQNLQHQKKLLFLDLSENQISAVEKGKLNTKHNIVPLTTVSNQHWNINNFDFKIVCLWIINIALMCLNHCVRRMEGQQRDRGRKKHVGDKEENMEREKRNQEIELP